MRIVAGRLFILLADLLIITVEDEDIIEKHGGDHIHGYSKGHGQRGRRKPGFSYQAQKDSLHQQYPSSGGKRYNIHSLQSCRKAGHAITTFLTVAVYIKINIR